MRGTREGRKHNGEVRTGRLNGLTDEKTGDRWFGGNEEQVKVGVAETDGKYRENELVAHNREEHNQTQTPQNIENKHEKQK